MKHQTLLSLLAVVEVEVMRDEVVAKVLVVGVLVFPEQVWALQALVEAVSYTHLTLPTKA